MDVIVTRVASASTPIGHVTAPTAAAMTTVSLRTPLIVSSLWSVPSDDTPALTDELIAALGRREPAAITAAYEALADPLFRYVRSRCRDDELAADIVESTFVELLRAPPTLEGGEVGLRRWLFTAARHNLIDELRKRRRRGDVALSEEPGADGGERVAGEPAAAREGGGGQPAHGDAPPTPEEQALAGERDEQVRDALATLPDDQREVLQLRFAGELSAAEIAEVLQRSPGAVRVLQHRALKALGLALGERHPEVVDDVDAARGDAAAHRTAARPRGPPPAAT